MKRLLALTLVLAVPVGRAVASDAVFALCDSSWSTAKCWVNNITNPPSMQPPVAGQDVSIVFQSTATLDVSPPALHSLSVLGTLTQPGNDITSNSLVVGASANGIGIYNLGGGTLTLGTLGGTGTLDFEVGGTVNQSGGTVTAAQGLALSTIPFAGHTGTYNLSDGTLNAVGLIVGNGTVSLGPLGTLVNAGIFTQTGGAASFTGPVIFGGPADPASIGGGSGTLNVGGGTFDVKGIPGLGMIVGGTGTGTVTQTDGTVTVQSGPDSGGLEIGRSTGGSGSYTISGGELNVDRESVAGANAYLIVGEAGNGTFTQSGGAHVSVEGTLSLGSTGGTGSYALSGDGTLLEADHVVIRNGTFTQSGGEVSIDTNSVGESGGSLSIFTGGAYVLSAGITNDSKLSVEFTEIIQGGIFNQSGGSNSVDGPLTLSNGGQYLLSGSGSTLTVGDDVTVTNASITQTGGRAEMNGALNLDGVGDTGVGAYSLGGLGSLAVAGEEVIGDGGHGSFTQTAGLNSAGGTLTLGRGAGGYGEYHLSGSASLAAGGDLVVGDAGTGLFAQTGGTAQIGGTLTLGASAGAQGSYTLSDGELHVRGDEVVGSEGSGAFTQTGGLHTVAGNLVIAGAAGGSGAYALTDGTLQVAGNELIGRSAGAAPSGANAFTQSAGINQVGGTLVVGAGSGGMYNLNGGSLTAVTEVVGAAGGAGIFSQTNGTNQAAQTLTIGGAPGASGTYNLSGGILVAGTKNTNGVVNNDTLNVTGPARIDANILNNASGVIRVSGAVLNVNGDITNLGTIALDPSHVTAGSLTVAAGGVLTAGRGDVLTLNGNFINQSLQNTLWNTSAAQLDFTGGVTHTFALAGHDAAGFASNFSWGTLVLGAGDTLDLTRGSGNALYVGALAGLDVSGDLITNVSGAAGLFIYYDTAENPLLHGNYFLEGGGELFALGEGGGGGSPVPEPSTLALLLAALALRSCRHRQAR